MSFRRLHDWVLAAVVCAAAGMVCLPASAQNQGAAGNSVAVPEGLPQWAFVAPIREPIPDDGKLHKVPGSNLELTLTQVRDTFNVADWHSGDHPPMPEVVVHGRKPNLRACGYCHLPNGQGRSDNTSLAGLPASYIIQQMSDFKNGLRKSADPRNGNSMIGLAKEASDEEVRSAAEYFSKLKYKPWIRVVESNTVPKTKISQGMLAVAEPEATEPIGQRIIEVPEDYERAELLRDARSGWVAYVPVGSIKKGEELVKTGGAKVAGGKIVAGRTTACEICHGADLKGLGYVPPLAGRSPGDLVRQIYNFRLGARSGEGAELMKPVVENLTDEEIVAIAAYLSSRTP